MVVAVHNVSMRTLKLLPDCFAGGVFCFSKYTVQVTRVFKGPSGMGPGILFSSALLLARSA